MNNIRKLDLDIIDHNKDDLHCMLEYDNEIYCIEYVFNNNKVVIVDYFNYENSTKSIPLEVKNIIKSLPKLLSEKH